MISVGEIAKTVRACRGIAVFKNLHHEVFDGWRRSSTYTKWAVAIALCYAVFFSLYTTSVYYSFKNWGSDLGKYVQAFWTTVNEGTLFRSNNHVMTANPSGSYFGWHFAPILFALIPLFALWQSAETLLIIKSFAIGLSILALYLLARELLKNEGKALAVAVLYALNPHLLTAQVFDFQEQCLLPLFLFLLYYFYLRGSALGFFAFTLLSLSVNEFVPLLLVAFFAGLAISDLGLRKALSRKLLMEKRGRWLVAASLISLSWIFLANAVISSIASVNLSEFFLVPVRAGEAVEIRKMAPSEIVATAFKEPSTMLEALLYDIWGKALGLLLFVTPLLGIPLLEPCSALPLLLYLLGTWITASECAYRFAIHYPLYLVHFMYIGFARALRRFKSLSELVGAVFVTTIALYSFSWLYCITFTQMHPSYDERAAILEQAVSMVPPNASVLADNNVFPHLACRSNAYCLFNETRFSELLKVLGGLDVEYIIVDRNWGNAWGGGGWAGKLIPYALEMLRSEEYGLYAWGGGVRVLKRGYSGDPMIFSNVERYNFHSLIIQEPNTACFDASSESGFVIAHEKGCGAGAIWSGPYTTLIPGKYRAIYRVRVDGEVEPIREVLYVDVASHYGAKAYGGKSVFGEDIPGDGGWFDVVVEFEVKEARSDFEFRGFAKSDLAIYLDYVLIQRLPEA